MIGGLPNLLHLPCHLSGRWTSLERNAWTAKALSEQAVVSVSFLICDGTMHWSKSGRLTSDSETVRLGLGVDQSDAARVVVACGGVGLPTRLSHAGARPVLSEDLMIETGVVWPLCRFDSSPTVDIFMLFLASSDVQWARNQIWRLSSSQAKPIAEPFRSILIGGRSGACPW
jgi:hypothetical protein